MFCAAQLKPSLGSQSHFCCLRSWEAALGVDGRSSREILLVKICNFHVRLHKVGLFQPVLSNPHPLAAPASSLVCILVKNDLVCLFVCLRILDLNGGSPPLTYKRFLHILSQLGDPEVPVRNLTAEDFQ